MNTQGQWKRWAAMKDRLCSWNSEDSVVKRRVVGISLIYLTIIYWEASFWSKASWVLELLLAFSREAFQSRLFPRMQKAFQGAGDQQWASSLSIAFPRLQSWFCLVARWQSQPAFAPTFVFSWWNADCMGESYSHCLPFFFFQDFLPRKPSCQRCADNESRQTAVTPRHVSPSNEESEAGECTKITRSSFCLLMEITRKGPTNSIPVCRHALIHTHAHKC